MRDLSIMIIAHNEREYVELAVQSIRKLADVDRLSVIVVDNNSTDGLSEWASVQEDITYVYVDEEKIPYGKLINQVIEALELNEDLFIISGHYMITPQILSRMQAVLLEDERIGAVGPVSNGLEYYQKISNGTGYKEAIEQALNVNQYRDKQVIGLGAHAIMFKKEALQNIGNFDEELLSVDYVMRDYCLRMMVSQWKLKVCEYAILWDAKAEESDVLYNEFEDAILEKKWGMHYFNIMYNENIIEKINRDSEECFSVLEIGCDCGATLLEIKNRYPNACIYGSELNEHAVGVAEHIANVVVNNIEENNLPYDNNMFDYIIFGDVLEHLRNPLAAINYCRKLLKANGCIIASIPNVMHISVMEGLLQGDFTYTETGLLDRTHIHLFTFNEILRMFQCANYEIEQMESIMIPISDEQSMLIDRLLVLGCGVERFAYETFQYVVRAKMLP